MRGRAVIVLGIVVATLIGVGVVPAGAARPPVVVGRGDVRCAGVVKWTGRQTAYHVLLTPRADGATTIVNVAGSINCTGTTGDARVGVPRVKITGSIIRVWECVFDSPLEGVKPYPWDFTFDWKGNRLATTRTRFTNYQGTGPRAFALHANVIWPAPGGSSTVVGSYAGQGTATLRVDFVPRLQPYLFTDGWCHHSSFPHKSASGKVYATLTV